MKNERGGILSKLFVIPIGVALMVGFFFLGYYVGKYQSKSSSQVVVMPPLPDIVSKNNPKQEEFTFYKTLTDKDNKTVSIDLKPRAANEDNIAEKKQGKTEEPRNTSAVSQKGNKVETRNEKASSSPSMQEPATKNKTVLAKKEPAITTTPSSKVRYTLQIASYQEKEMADDEVKKMKKQGYAAFIVSSQLPDKGMWYRVRLGSFTNKAAADKLRKEIQAKAGVSTIVVME